MTRKVLKIGIAPLASIRARTIAIARGEFKPGPSAPKVWFTSVESLAQVLSSKNQLLLDTIRRARPASLKELAKLADRQESNLSRTLRTMERYGLVKLARSKTGTIVPTVPYDRVMFDFAFDHARPGVRPTSEAAE
jgi:predicted transcriptional regulator